jgi:hypothetical protein
MPDVVATVNSDEESTQSVHQLVESKAINASVGRKYVRLCVCVCVYVCVCVCVCVCVWCVCVWCVSVCV